MADDRPEDIGSSPDLGRPKRAPPTIDLEATEVTGTTQNADSGSADAKAGRPRWTRRTSAVVVTSAIISAISGAAAAALVIGAAWFMGWPGETPAPVATPQVNTAAVDALTARIADVEARSAKPAAVTPDPAVAARTDALEKSLASLRSEFEAVRDQSEKLAAAVNEVKSAPREAPPPPDLSAINERLTQIERAARVQTAESAKESAKPADDVPLRRVVAASLLDVSLRHGEPYAVALAAAKPLAANADVLKPLEPFAATGVPNANALSRELLALVPKLSPPQNSTIGSGLVDRLQAGAAKLVRIERIDAIGSDRNAIVTRVTAAALRNDIVEARRELNTLSPADRAAAQPWIDKVNARDAALAASRQFAAEAMAALAKPSP